MELALLVAPVDRLLEATRSDRVRRAVLGGPEGDDARESQDRGVEEDEAVDLRRDGGAACSKASRPPNGVAEPGSRLLITERRASSSRWSSMPQGGSQGDVAVPEEIRRENAVRPRASPLGQPRGSAAPDVTPWRQTIPGVGVPYEAGRGRPQVPRARSLAPASWRSAGSLGRARRPPGGRGPGSRYPADP